MSLARRMRALIRNLAPAGTRRRAALAAVATLAGQPPVNQGTLDSSEEAVGRDVGYALRIGREYLELLRGQGCDPAGRQVLELGPGINYGSVMVLACAGARVAVTDRFPVGWRSPYHDRFYAALLDALRRDGADVRPLERMLACRGFPDDVLRELPAAVEGLPLPDGCIDVTLSNAVLEHVIDPVSACAELHRVTRPGGMAFHQVDFRDHRDFSRPLEYLLLEPRPFREMFDERHGECGGQTRPKELEKLMAGCGFEVVAFQPNWLAEDRYLDEFIPRLRACSSHYRDWSREDLRVISGRFILRRPA